MVGLNTVFSAYLLFTKFSWRMNWLHLLSKIIPGYKQDGATPTVTVADPPSLVHFASIAIPSPVLLNRHTGPIIIRYSHELLSPAQNWNTLGAARSAHPRSARALIGDLPFCVTFPRLNYVQSSQPFGIGLSSTSCIVLGP